MKNIFIVIAIMTVALTSCRDNSYTFKGAFDKDFDGKTVVLTNYDDTTAIDSVKISNGNFFFKGKVSAPTMAMLMIDGKTHAYLLLEPGDITLPESAHFAIGTEYNNKLSSYIAQMDSVENLDDMPAYITLVKELYAENRTNPLGIYIGTELSRYLELPEINKMLTEATPEVKNSHRIAGYRHAAELRKSTIPGMKFTDFTAVQPNGKKMKLSDYAGNGKYLLVDFWASWCPYCIKELPELKHIYETYGSDKLEILGVAVRDKAEDTKQAVDKHGISWNIMYNAERIPYNIYGFTGIPHLMLIAPDGTIVARGESAKQTEVRLSRLLNANK